MAKRAPVGSHATSTCSLISSASMGSSCVHSETKLLKSFFDLVCRSTLTHVRTCTARGCCTRRRGRGSWRLLAARDRRASRAGELPHSGAQYAIVFAAGDHWNRARRRCRLFLSSSCMAAACRSRRRRRPSCPCPRARNWSSCDHDACGFSHPPSWSAELRSSARPDVPPEAARGSGGT